MLSSGKLTDPTELGFAEALQDRWKKQTGVQVTIEPFEQKTFLQNQLDQGLHLFPRGRDRRFSRPNRVPRRLCFGRQQQLERLAQSRI